MDCSRKSNYCKGKSVTVNNNILCQTHVYEFLQEFWTNLLKNKVNKLFFKN